MSAKPVMIPSPDHPITIDATDAHVTVRAGGQVVADTTSSLTLQEAAYPAVLYIPMADVDTTLLESTSTETYCPFKGDASYFTITGGDEDLVDALWTYVDPHPAVAEIAGHVAFYPDRVEITVDEAD